MYGPMMQEAIEEGVVGSGVGLQRGIPAYCTSRTVTRVNLYKTKYDTEVGGHASTNTPISEEKRSE